MPKTLLSVSHLQQRKQADCLPVCVQMVTDYLGLNLSYTKIYECLGTRWFGTPFRRIQALELLNPLISVSIEHLGLPQITYYLRQRKPVIAGIHTADLPYWTRAVDHVVVVIGIDDTHVYVLDPHMEYGPVTIAHAAFELAQLAFDNLCAVLWT